ncbi:MAG TPA: hypothetical protein VNS32_20385 [Flavisolibacter sp.]|nr:hypothetical protein [Flavisolibacter sp.]
MTIILEETNQFTFHSDLSLVIRPFGDYFQRLNWLITDLWCFSLEPPDKKKGIGRLNHEDLSIVFSGKELYDLIMSEKIQFIWGVFSGFEGDIPVVKEDDLPYADGNRDIWVRPEDFQLPSAQIEIICWDSSATIVKFKDKAFGYRFLEVFPEAKQM